MKQFTIIKVGYRAGSYGCIAEYFTTIVLDGKNRHTLGFYGLYGSESRVAGVLKQAGFEEFYTPSFYGRMTLKDVTKWHMSEYTAIEYIKRGFKKSDAEIKAEQRHIDKIMKN
jgi:hypothetical protein